MATPDTDADRAAHRMEPIGKAAFIASVGGARGHADWTNPDHRLRWLSADGIVPPVRPAHRPQLTR